MSTKTPKRKRAAAAATPPVEASASVDAAPVASVSAEALAIPADAAPASVAEAVIDRTQEAVVNTTGEPVVALASNSTVKDAAALKDALLHVLDAPASVAIEAKSVERIDTAIIQVLCAFVRDRTARNLAVNWRGTPQPLLDAARLLGVSSLLALPSNATEA